MVTSSLLRLLLGLLLLGSTVPGPPGAGHEHERSPDDALRLPTEHVLPLGRRATGWVDARHFLESVFPDRASPEPTDAHPPARQSRGTREGLAGVHARAPVPRHDFVSLLERLPYDALAPPRLP